MLFKHTFTCKEELILYKILFKSVTIVINRILNNLYLILLASVILMFGSYCIDVRLIVKFTHKGEISDCIRNRTNYLLRSEKLISSYYAICSCTCFKKGFEIRIFGFTINKNVQFYKVGYRELEYICVVCANIYKPNLST